MTYQVVQIGAEYWAHADDGTDANHAGAENHAGPFDTREEAEEYCDNAEGKP